MKKLLATLSAVALAGFTALALAQPAPPADAIVRADYNLITVGEKTKRYYIGNIHYKDANGEFKPFDFRLSFDAVRRGWTFTTHNFHPFLPEFADGEASFRDVWKGKDRTITYKAVASHVQGRLATDPTNPHMDSSARNPFGVVYDDAFGAGRDLWYYFKRENLNSVVAIRDPNTYTQPLVFEWEVGLPVGEKMFDAPLKRREKPQTERNPDVKFRATKSIAIGTDTDVGEANLTYIGEAEAWDSTGRKHPVTLEFLRVNGKIIKRKTLPVASLQAANGTLFTDTTTSYFTGSGDGYVESIANSNFATVRADTTGAANDETSINAFVDANQGANFYLDRGRLIADTSAEPNGQTYASGSWNLWILTVNDGDDDANGNLVIGESTVVSDTALANSDIDNLLFATAWTTAVDLTGLATNAYKSFPLNATGLLNVNTTGMTDMAMINGHDFAANAPDADSTVSFSMSEDTSGTKDPYIELVTGGTTGTVMVIFSKAIDLLAPFAFAND